jgi:hypothetical protein
MAVSSDLGKTGNADYKKVGHTYSGVLGSEPNAQPKGNMGNEPVEQTWK